MASGNGTGEQQLSDYAKEYVAFMLSDYDLKHAMEAFKAPRYFPLSTLIDTPYKAAERTSGSADEYQQLVPPLLRGFLNIVTYELYVCICE